MTPYFVHPILHLFSLPMVSLRLLNIFFSKAATDTSGQLPAVGGGAPAVANRAPGGQKPLEN